MVAVAAAIEDAGLDSGLLTPLGEQLPGARRLLAGLQLAKLRLGPVDRGQGAALACRRSAGRRYRGWSDTPKAADAPPVPEIFARTRRRRRSRLCCLVSTVMRACPPCGRRARRCSGFPCPCRAPGGRRLRMSAATWPTSCLSIPRTISSVGWGTSNSMPSGASTDDRVRVAERQLEVAALELGAVADPLDLEALLEALGDPLDHVGDQAPGQPVQGPVLAAIGGPGHGQRAIRLLDTHLWRDCLGELALRTLDRDLASGELDADSVGDGNGLSTDAAHARITRRRRRPRRRLPSRSPRGRSSRRSRC